MEKNAENKALRMGTHGHLSRELRLSHADGHGNKNRLLSTKTATPFVRFSFCRNGVVSPFQYYPVI